MRRRRATSTTVRFVSRGRARARRSRRVSPPPRSLPRRRATFRTFRVRRSISTRPSRRCVVSRPARGSPRRGYAPRSTRREREFEPDADFESPSGLAETRRRRRQRRRRLRTPPPDRIRLERRRLSRVARFRVSDDSAFRDAVGGGFASRRVRSRHSEQPAHPQRSVSATVRVRRAHARFRTFGVTREASGAARDGDPRATKSRGDCATHRGCVLRCVRQPGGALSTRPRGGEEGSRRRGFTPPGRRRGDASAGRTRGGERERGAPGGAPPASGRVVVGLTVGRVSRARRAVARGIVARGIVARGIVARGIVARGNRGARNRGARNRGARNRGARNRGARPRRLDRRRPARRVSTIGPPPRLPTPPPRWRSGRGRSPRPPPATSSLDASRRTRNNRSCSRGRRPEPPCCGVSYRTPPRTVARASSPRPDREGGANASSKSRNIETIAGSSKESSSDASSAVSAVAWSPGGGRFAIGTADGVVSTWRADGALGPRATPAATRAPTKGDARRGVGIFVAVGGGGGGVETRRRGGFVGAVGYPRAADEPPAGALAAHEGGATAMCVLPGTTLGGSPWPMLATAGRLGDLAALDLRMLGGGGAAAVVWRAGRDAHGHAAAVKSLAVLHPPAERRRVDGVGSVLVSGCKDGDVRAWSARVGRHLQHVRAAHERHTFIAPRGGGRNVLQVGVSKIVALEGGALTCGGDGTVKLFRLAPDAFRLAA